MFDDPEGPIEHYSWGKFVVCGKEHSKTGAGKTGEGKDIRMIGTEVSKWKERKGHNLDKTMITGIFEHKIDVLIIGTGADGMLECPDKVREFILKKGIKKLIIEKTPAACRIYNECFKKGKKVALLAHGTC